MPVPGVVAPVAHPHGAPHVEDGPELVPDEAGVAMLLVGAQSPALNGHGVRRPRSAEAWIRH